jgi:hypothetical protein
MMKYLAHTNLDVESKIIHIYNVVNGLNSKNASAWEGKTYYSLKYLTPMIAKTKSIKNSPHFAFKKGSGGNENSGGGESAVHDYSKFVIYNNKFIHLKVFETEDTLFFSEVLIEYPFEKKYVVDLYVCVAKENKFDLPVGSHLAIELVYTNDVKPSKIQYFRNKNIPLIRIEVYKEIELSKDYDLNLLQKRLEGYFSKTRYGKWLHNPNYRKRYECQKPPIIEIKVDHPLIQSVSKPVDFVEIQKVQVREMPISILPEKPLWKKISESLIKAFKSKFRSN